VIVGVADMCAIVVGGVFLAAGSAKIVYNDRFATALRLAGVIPARLVPVVRVALPPIELVIGALVIAVNRIGGAVAAAALVGLSAIVWPSVRAGADLPCACFGGSQGRADSGLLARNAVLLVYAALVAGAADDGPYDAFRAAFGRLAETARLAILLLMLAFVPFLLARIASAWQAASKIVDKRVIERSRALAARMGQ
jgi:hypothetical protein